MKKTLLFMVLLMLAGCSAEEETPEAFDLSLVPIEEVSMPESFVTGNTYSITLTYKRPTACHTYSTTSFDSIGNEFTFAVVNSHNPEDPNCQPQEDLTAITSFRFDAERNDFYIFKFWQGEDENKNPKFITKQIPVSKV